jgi:integrase
MGSKAGRRANGEGSVYELSDGRWRFSVRLGKDENGRPVRKDFTASTRAAVIRKVEDEKARNGGVLQPPVDMTVADLVKRYLDDRDPSRTTAKKPKDDDRSQIAVSTFEGWELGYRHVKGLLSMRVDQFGPKDVPRIRTALKAKCGPRTVQIIWQLMRLAFDEAIRSEVYLRANPWRIHSPPSYEARYIRALQQDEIPRFKAAAKGDRFEGIFLLGLLHRVRLGEALGLEWSSINFDDGAIGIHQQVLKDGKQARVKTTATKRTIYAGPVLLNVLKRRRQEADREGHTSPFVFTNERGAHPSRSKYIGTHFRDICKSAKIEDFTIHGLCHTWTVEAMDDTGVPVTVKAMLGGWKGTRMMTERYGMHERADQHREASLKIQRKINRRGPKA